LPGLASQSQRLRSSGLNDLLGAWRDSLSAGPGGGRTPDTRAAVVTWSPTTFAPLAPGPPVRRLLPRLVGAFYGLTVKHCHPMKQKPRKTGYNATSPHNPPSRRRRRSPHTSRTTRPPATLHPDDEDAPHTPPDPPGRRQRSIQTTKTLPAHLQNHPAADNAPSRRPKRFRQAALHRAAQGRATTPGHYDQARPPTLTGRVPPEAELAAAVLEVYQIDDVGELRAGWPGYLGGFEGR
jgi:hypothetical protein